MNGLVVECFPSTKEVLGLDPQHRRGGMERGEDGPRRKEKSDKKLCIV